MRDTITKVLPFDSQAGYVPGHEIIRHDIEWLDSPIKAVAFERWDADADMMVEVQIHWTKWTKYAKSLWPRGGEIRAVVLENGRRILATAMICHHYDAASYATAPIICRDAFAIKSLMGHTRLIEVAGVGAWLRSARDAAATAKFLACPWERDNRAFDERMAAAA